ncbi:MAG: MBL fold metallo-hydrolase [Candidatus Hydrothermales bacterium]
MRIVPLGADSLGTRAFSFYVETSDIKITVDPSCALAPRRNGYPPTPREIYNLNETYKKIRYHVLQSDIVIISHFHNDHYPFFDLDIFLGKILLIKDYKKDMNYMQVTRAKKFVEELQKRGVRYFFADFKEFSFNRTKILFSDGLWHGRAKREGKVIGFIIEEKKSLFYSSDTQGLWDKTLREFLKGKRIDYFFVDGPSLYQSKKSEIDEFVRDISDILKELNESKLVLDHHFVRDLSYSNYIKSFREVYGDRVFTCAEFLGEKDTPLEALRREYYEGGNF